MSVDIEQLRQLLKVHQDLPVNNPYPASLLKGSPQEAAVLIPLMRISDEWQVLFIRRTEHPDDPHSGQTAFPGGMRELHDKTLTDTALRETQEEIGLHPASIHVMGTLGRHMSISNAVITPVVGIVKWPQELRLNGEEVAHTFHIPFQWLMQKENTGIRRYRPGGPDSEEINAYYYKKYAGELIWGTTARILLSLSRLYD